MRLSRIDRPRGRSHVYTFFFVSFCMGNNKKLKRGIMNYFVISYSNYTVTHLFCFVIFSFLFFRFLIQFLICFLLVVHCLQLPCLLRYFSLCFWFLICMNMSHVFIIQSFFFVSFQPFVETLCIRKKRNKRNGMQWNEVEWSGMMTSFHYVTIRFE